MENRSIYDFEANKLNGEKIKLDEFEGKTIVVVNTASKCGLTPQYEGLESMYQKYKDQGLVILGFPCNQFGKQEKGNSDEIQEFCQVNYGVSFPMFEKIEVNGKSAHPIYQYLKSELSGGLLGSKIKWNFTKFVIDKNGNPVKRYAPTTSPEKMESFIEGIV
ncbi:MAG: glutathione peroxidase [Crocinitomicaceae bacterium]